MKMDADPSDAPGISQRYEKRSGHLLVEVTGWRGSADDGLAAFQRIAAECERVNADRLLIVDLAHGAADTPQALGELMRGVGDTALARIRVAYFVRDVKNVQAFQHAELDGIELGLNIRLFTSQREAEIWLQCGAGD